MAVMLKEGPYGLTLIDIYKDVYVEPLRALWVMDIVLCFDDANENRVASAVCSILDPDVRAAAEQWLYDLIAVTAVGRPPTETERKLYEAK